MYRETVASTLLGRNVSVGEPSAPIFDKMSNDYDNDDKHNSTDFNAKSASNFQEHDEGDEEEDLEGV